MTTEDLWGDLPKPDTMVKPGTLLREQASLLGSKTQNIVEAYVESFATKRKNRVGLRMSIRCAAVDNYEFQVLTIDHDLLTIYPISLTSAMDMVNYEIQDEEQFRSALRQIFSSEKLRRVIAALLREATTTN